MVEKPKRTLGTHYVTDKIITILEDVDEVEWWNYCSTMVDCGNNRATSHTYSSWADCVSECRSKYKVCCISWHPQFSAPGRAVSKHMYLPAETSHTHWGKTMFAISCDWTPGVEYDVLYEGLCRNSVSSVTATKNDVQCWADRTSVSFSLCCRHMFK